MVTSENASFSEVRCSQDLPLYLEGQGDVVIRLTMEMGLLCGL